MANSYGAVIDHHGQPVDLGAISDRRLSALLVEYIEAADPEHADPAGDRGAEDVLALVRAEIDDRLRQGRFLERDLSG